MPFQLQGDPILKKRPFTFQLLCNQQGFLQLSLGFLSTFISSSQSIKQDLISVWNKVRKYKDTDQRSSPTSSVSFLLLLLLLYCICFFPPDSPPQPPLVTLPLCSKCFWLANSILCVFRTPGRCGSSRTQWYSRRWVTKKWNNYHYLQRREGNAARED